MVVGKIDIKQTKNGADYKALTTESGEQANVFQFHSLYEKIEIGSDVTLVKDGKYFNVPDPDKEEKNGSQGNSGRSKGTYMQDKKNEQISHSMDKKEEAIKLASTARMATDMVVAMKYTGEDFAKEKWHEWRAWFYVNWSEVQHDLVPPFERNSDGSETPTL